MRDIVPSLEVQEAFLEPTTELIRRIEIYEADQSTPWKPELWPSLLLEGGVGADYSRDERRTLDVTLDNSDGLLDPQAGNLWYDKVFKVIFGIWLRQEQRDPRVLICEEFGVTGQGLAIKSLLSSVGIKRVHYQPQVDLYSEVAEFDVLISISSDHTRKLTLLTEAWSKGKGIITCGVDATAVQLPLIIAGAAGGLSTDAGDRSFIQNTAIVDELMLGWSGWALAGPQSYRKINSLVTRAFKIADTSDTTNGLSVGIAAHNALNGNRWVHVQQSEFDVDAFSTTDTALHMANCAAFLKAASVWVDNYSPLEKWEVQLGEFLADSIADADEFRDRIKITGRDFTKKCIQSKLSKATTFLKTQTIEEVISAVASNAGITKLDIPVTGVTLEKDMTWERDTTRWDIIKEIAQAKSYQVYFDAYGYLKMRPMNDPLLTPPTLILNTGPRGNLVSRGVKTSDTQLFNHVTVVGESSDSTVPLVFGEAINSNPNSPSAIVKIGERTYNISSPLVTSELQATNLAQQLLAVSSLEEFELDWSSILLPWIEPGDIVELQDDDPYWGATRYLISQLSFPLDLGPMSGNGKRVTKV